MAKLIKIAEELRFTYQKPFAYGNVQGFDTTVQLTLNDSTLTVNFQAEPLDANQYNELSQYAANNKVTLKILQFRTDGTSLLFTLYSPMGFTTEKVKEFFGATASQLIGLGVRPNETCVFCHEQGDLINIKVNGIQMKAHSHCKTEQTRQIEDAEARNPMKEKNLVNGIIGALLGAIIGSIPWIIVELFIGFFAAFLGILIGYSAFFFYKKFGAAVTKNTKYVILVATVLGVIFTNLVVATYVIVTSGGALVLGNYAILYTDSYFGPMLLEELGIGMLMGLLALPAIFRKVQSEVKSKTVIE